MSGNSRVVWSVGVLLLIVLVALSVLPFQHLGKSRVEAAIAVDNPDTFISAAIADADSLDPAYAYDTASSEQIQAIYEPLIYYDGANTGGLVPVLATEWTISPDGMAYRFKIRQGVKFHNGNDMTPEDVEYSFERGMVQDYIAGPQWVIFEPLLGVYSSRDDVGNIVVPLDDIKNAVQVDGDWVQFNLVAPYAPFLHVLTGTWGSVVDKQWCIAQGDWDGTQASYEALNDPAPNSTPLNDIANGTGPFKLEQWDPGVQISLVRNDAYWGTKPSLARFITKVIPEWAARKLALLNGDVDWAYVPRANMAELESAEGLLLCRDLPQLVAEAIFFQFDIDPGSTRIGSGLLDGNGIPPDFFQDLDVRLGFTYCFDWDTYIADALMGEMQQTASPAIEGLPHLYPAQEMYSLDLASAEQHLRTAWGGQVWDKGFKLTLTYNAGNLETQTACQILKANLAQVNPKFQITVVPYDFWLMLDEIFSGQAPMFHLGWEADYLDPHDFFFPFMHSQGAYSGIQGYNDPAVDALIENGLTTVPENREGVYYELQRIYHEDAPGIMLGQPLGRRYFRDWVWGFVFNPIDPSDVGHFTSLGKDFTPPATPLVADDGDSTVSTTQLHGLWTSSDPESGIAEYQYAVGTTPGGTDVLTWTSAGTATEVTRTDLSLGVGSTYYFAVKARNGANDWSSVGVSNGITVSDSTAPTTPVITDDGDSTTNVSSLHALWSSSDPESGIAEYQYAIGTSSGATDVVGWTSAGINAEATHSGLSLSFGGTYYFAVKAKNVAGLWSEVGASNGITVSDSTPPSTPVVTDEGATTSVTTQLQAAWTSADPESGITECQYAIGTSAGGTDIVDWTSVGANTEVTHDGLRLSKGTTYYLAVKAKNGAGLWSSIGVSDGILVEAGNGEVGGCCSSSNVEASPGDVAIAWGTLGLCSATGLLFARRLGRRNKR